MCGSFFCECLLHLMFESLYETVSNVNFFGFVFSIEATNLIASKESTLIFVNWSELIALTNS